MSGKEVYSVYDGYISYIGFDKFGYGNYIVEICLNGYKVIYGHLDNICVDIGQKIPSNKKIAEIGPKILDNGIYNGNTTGPHLHITIYDNNSSLINPLDILKNIVN